MAALFAGLGTLLGGGATAGAAAGAAATGISTGGLISTILQGTATVLGVASAFSAGAAEEDALKAQAIDAEREQSIQNLQGIERRSSIKAAMRDAQGAIDTAYASSGVDLSFGTAAQARREAYREADLMTTTSTGTELTNGARLMERAANYRNSAKRARRAGIVQGLTAGIGGAADIARRY